MSLPQFRPRSPTEIVDAAIQLGRRHYQPLLVLSAIIAIPNLLLGLVTQWLVPPAVQASGQLADGADIALVLLTALVSVVWMLIGFGALVASTSAAYLDGRALEPMAALRRSLRRAVPLVGANVLAYLLVMVLVVLALVLFGIVGGVVAAAIGASGAGGADVEAMATAVAAIVGLAVVAVVVVGGLLLWSRYASITAAVMLEDRGAMGAIRRSTELARGNVWRSAGVVFIMSVLYAVAFATSWALFMLVLRDVNLSGNVAGVLVLALYPFLGAMLTLLYYDLRIRREGYDLELMARALDDAGGAGGAAAGTHGPPGATPPAGASA